MRAGDKITFRGRSGQCSECGGSGYRVNSITDTHRLNLNCHNCGRRRFLGELASLRLLGDAAAAIASSLSTMRTTYAG
jgi:hypothetical protein